MATNAPAATNRDISHTEALKITTEAATWDGTPYSLRGPDSVKSVAGDCSGSTFQIYRDAGFPYAYQQAAAFQAYAVHSGLFRQLGVGEAMQDGDILSWSNHMALYATFKDAPAKAKTQRVNAHGKTWTQENDIWTASHPNGAAYGPAALKFWRPDPPKIFRYQKSAS